MRFTSILSSMAVLSMASASDLALYWGQASGGAHQESLGDYCRNSAGDIYLISFLNSFGSGRELSMEVSGYWNNLPNTNLPDAASTIGEDIKTCQSLGKKVLVSMGGAAGSYGFNSDADAQKVAQDLWNIFGGGQSSTRPFGDAKIDGFDLDLENNLNASEYIAFVNELRQLYSSDPSKQYYVSAAPQCPFPDASVGQAVAHSQFDFLFIQFYNNYCTPLGSNFNWDTWQSFASDQSPNRNVKLFLGLPGAQSAAGSGYATPDQVKETVSKISSTPNFGGIMLWDAAQANDNNVDGTTFVQEMKNILDAAGPSEPQSTPSTPAPAPSTVASSSSSSAAPAWVPETSSTSSSSLLPLSTSSSPTPSANVEATAQSISTASPYVVTSTATKVTMQPGSNGENVWMTVYQTYTTTEPCPPSASATAGSDSLTTTVHSTSYEQKTLPGVTSTKTAADVQATAESTTSKASSYVVTSTAAKVTTQPGPNGGDVWVTVYETYTTTEPCPPSASATAGSDSLTTTTVHSTSQEQKTLPGVTSTKTSAEATAQSTSTASSYVVTSTAAKVTTQPGPKGGNVWVTVYETYTTTEPCPPSASATQTSLPRTTSAEHHDFTSNGEVYEYDTTWATAYTTLWMR